MKKKEGNYFSNTNKMIRVDRTVLAPEEAIRAEQLNRVPGTGKIIMFSASSVGMT